MFNIFILTLSTNTSIIQLLFSRICIRSLKGWLFCILNLALSTLISGFTVSNSIYLAIVISILMECEKIISVVLSRNVWRYWRWIQTSSNDLILSEINMSSLRHKRHCRDIVSHVHFHCKTLLLNKASNVNRIEYQITNA